MIMNCPKCNIEMEEDMSDKYMEGGTMWRCCNCGHTEWKE